MTTKDPKKAPAPRKKASKKAPAKKKAAPKKNGRPSKFTPEVRSQILLLLRAGSYRETACAAAGIDSSTLRKWLLQAAAGSQAYRAFAEEMTQAEAQAEAKHVIQITKASTMDWRAGAWILSRKHADRWGDKIQVEFKERVNEFLQLVEDVLGSESATKVIEELVRRNSGEASRET